MSEISRQIEEISDRIASDVKCFFTCTEHRGYPFGKAFRPYDSESLAEAAMIKHEQETGHRDTSLFCSANIMSLSLSDQDNLEETLNSTEKINRINCFCVAGCYKDSGDSSHFRLNVDVDCGLSIEQKRIRVVPDLINHYITAHDIDFSDPEGVIREIRANTEIKCYTHTS